MILHFVAQKITFPYLQIIQYYNYEVWEPGCLKCGRQGACNQLSGQPGAKERGQLGKVQTKQGKVQTKQGKVLHLVKEA